MNTVCNFIEMFLVGPYAGSLCCIALPHSIRPHAGWARHGRFSFPDISLALLAFCSMCTASVPVWALAQLRKLWTTLWSLLGPSGRFRKPLTTRASMQLSSRARCSQLTHSFSTSHGTLPERERWDWRARPGSGGGRGGDKDGHSKNALLAPQAFTTAEKKKDTQCERALSLSLSQLSVTSDETVVSTFEANTWVVSHGVSLSSLPSTCNSIHILDSLARGLQDTRLYNRKLV